MTTSRYFPLPFAEATHCDPATSQGAQALTDSTAAQGCVGVRWPWTGSHGAGRNSGASRDSSDHTADARDIVTPVAGPAPRGMSASKACVPLCALSAHSDGLVRV